jgi:hypothetical protein
MRNNYKLFDLFYYFTESNNKLKYCFHTNAGNIYDSCRIFISWLLEIDVKEF